MIARQPYLPRFMAGGPGNPLGARAMYLGNTLYRIHGTNAPSTIGQRVSSGCIRLTNEDVQDLYNRVTLGAKVVVLPDTGRRAPANVASAPAPQPLAQPATRSAYKKALPEPRYQSRAMNSDMSSAPTNNASMNLAMRSRSSSRHARRRRCRLVGERPYYRERQSVLRRFGIAHLLRAMHLQTGPAPRRACCFSSSPGM